jgi:hypothetical protein
MYLSYCSAFNSDLFDLSHSKYGLYTILNSSADNSTSEDFATSNEASLWSSKLVGESILPLCLCPAISCGSPQLKQ